MPVIYNSVDNLKPADTSGPQYVDKTDTTKLADQDQFLKLFTAQLQYQNPMDPMSNQDFTAQLAQFSSLEQLTQMNEKLEGSLNTNMLLNKSISNSMATTLIGKQIKVKGNYVQVKNGTSTKMMFTVPEAIHDVEIEILDSSGKAIRNISQDYMGTDLTEFQWDGKNNGGTIVEDDQYTYVIKGTNADGEEIKLSGYATGVVDGVKYDGNTTMLVCGQGEFDIGDVLEVIEFEQIDVVDETDNEDNETEETDETSSDGGSSEGQGDDSSGEENFLSI